MYNRFVFGGCALVGFLIGRQFGTGTLATYTSILVAYHLYLVFLVVRRERSAGLHVPVGRTVLIHLACLVPLLALAMSRHYIPVFAVIRLLTLGLAIAEAKWIFQGQSKLEIIQSKRILEAITGDAAAVTQAEVAPVAAPAVATSFAADEPAAEAPVASTLAVAATEAFSPVTTGPVAIAPVTPVPVASYSIAAASDAHVPAATAPVATAPVAPAPVASAPTVYVPVATYSFVPTTASPEPKLTQSVGDEYEEFIRHMQQEKRPFRKPGVTVKQEFELWLAARTRVQSQPAPKSSKSGGLSGLLKVSRNLD